MHFQFEVAPPTPAVPYLPQQAHPADASVELLAKLVDLQSQQLTLMRASQANQDHLARWRALLGRWQDDFPGMGRRCKAILPPLERAYLELIADLAERLNNEETDGIENEFGLNEFLDRYGVRLSQLGTILGLIGTLADAGATDSTP
jgi:hypothetical protein